MDDIATRAPRHAWGMAKVVGDSMVPTLQAGDRLLVSYRRTPEPGSVVVARLADGAVVVKRAVERRTTASGRPGWWLLSDNPAAPGVIDSRHRGPVVDADVIAVVVGRLWPRPRILR
ncbi:S24/S26 family peptidase [Nocardioides panzhihuensis]|uniref:Phage repressor protein C with HTH and peptisase S24 domain n=1 Tax=Nocardioides panzhihuensis TaxID=860243 RepID=A0A7Z0ITN4_9ACTN|nr:S24/S26 family peptidase [Nocardioides panzhihuensis]NYI79042.1 phage repressor protein C with HTH and peptisase S24 domain [Nocardioides panzhihuensis]